MNSLRQGTFIILTAIFLFTALNKAVGQTDSLIAKLTYKKQFKFSQTTCIYDNLKFDNTGEKLIKSLPMPGGELTLSYFNYLKNGYGLNVGLGITVAPYMTYFKFNAPPNSIFQTGPYKEDYQILENASFSYIQDIFTLPVSIQKTFAAKHDKIKLSFIDIGFKLNYKIAFPYSIVNGGTYGINDTTEAKLFRFSLKNTPDRIIISYFVKYEWQKLLKDQNTFQYNFVLHYSPTKIGKGTYEFFNMPNQSYGTVAQNINFIGFEIAYGLTTSRRLKE